MRMHRCYSVVLWLVLVLYQSNYCHGEENESPKIRQKTTYRSALERSIQSAIGVAGFLTRPFISTSTDKSMQQVSDGGFGKVLNKFKDQIHAIVPGTRWCGDGNIAANDNDLGYFQQADACCRQHDKCEFNIESGASYANLKNDGLFTRSACECDHAFYNCLKDARGPLAHDIGFTYFTILGPQCINYDYPFVSCTKRGGTRIIMRKCIAYKYNTSQPMTFQWMDNPDF